MRGAALPAVLVDGEDALDAARGAAEGLLHGVAQDALGEAPVAAREAVRGAVVDGEDEAEVDGVPQAPGVVEEAPTDRRLVAAEGAGERCLPRGNTPPKGCLSSPPLASRREILLFILRYALACRTTLSLS